MRRKRWRKAQALIEYSLLFALVAAAIIATHRYVYRSVNARLKQIQEVVTYSRD
ncbi:class III signal peptide-containing protein [Candidatus Omnitrophota bacterium]